MRRVAAPALVLFLLASTPTLAQLVAERVTRDNASSRLFGGSDANGGVGDWYLSNGVVEAIVDDAGFAPDLLARGVAIPMQSLLAPTGGTLIDVGLVGKGNDQLNQVFQVANLSPSTSFFYTGVKPSVTASSASLTAQGVLVLEGVSGPTKPTVLVQTVYSVSPGDRFITLTSTILNNSGTALPIFNITDAIPLSARNLLPFVPFPGRGFNSPRLVLTPAGIAAALGLYPFVALPGNVSPSDGVMDTVTGASCGEVSYALVPVAAALDPDGPAGPASPVVQPLQAMVGVNGPLVSASGNPFDPTRSPSLPAGGSFTYVRRLLVGDRNDVSSVSGAVYTALLTGADGQSAVGDLSGSLNLADGTDVSASVLLEGTLAPFFGDKVVPITQVRTVDGRFTTRVPFGTYTLRVTSPERDDLVVKDVRVGPGTTTLTLPPLSARGSVRCTVTENGQGVPAKLTFIGLDGTPNPSFSRYFDAATFDTATFTPLEDLQPSSYTGVPALNFAFTADGTLTQAIRPGKYKVIASRGFEYTVDIENVTVVAGQESAVDLALQRVVDTRGYVSADFHVHSGRSFDASTPLEDRVKTYAAEGVEVLVSTDHNFIVDLAPVVQKLGLTRFVKTIVGNELTSSLPNPVFPQGYGHHNMFPLLVDPLAPRRGAVLTEYVSGATFYDRMAANNPGVDKVVQLNHPRAGVAGLTIIGLFNTLPFDPTKPIPQALLGVSLLGTGRRNIDFDSMEIYNGPSIGEYQQVRNDWFSLIRQGYFKTGTAVSDSHRAVMESAGFPRSYVATPTDDPAQLTDDMITRSVKAANVIGTSGPFIRLDVEGKPIGSLITRRTGPVTFNLRVSAPAWVPVEEIRVLANGRVVRVFDDTTIPPVKTAPADPASPGGVIRFNASFKLSPPADTAYTVEAGVRLPAALDTNGDGVIDTGDTNGDGVIDARDRGLVQPPSPAIYAAIEPGFVPLAFTNPVFVDRDGNGKYDPPGVDPSLVPRSAVSIVRPVEPLSSSFDYFPWTSLCIGADEVRLFLDGLVPGARLVAERGGAD